MIGRIQGKLLEISDNLLLIDVSGVAYEVEATSAALAEATTPGVDIALFAVLYYLAGWHLILAHVVAFITAISIGFFINKFWTFRDHSRGGEAVLKGFAFLASSAISLGIATAVIWLAAQAMPAIIAKVVSDLCAFAWTYAAARLLIFRRS